jgi:molecular chaperone HtpG
MVADKVEVESRSGLDTKAHKWISDGKSGYDISEIKKDSRGTKITLFINEANKELLEDWKIRELIKKYSNYVGVPIMMLELDNRSEEEKKKEAKERKLEQINETKPIWKKSKSEIKDGELNEFYKSISMDFNEPLTSISANVE